MAGNKSLSAATQAKQDEFYTQLVDVEKELRHYTDSFKGKVVFCNCDDPYESNFFKYFAMNFNHLEIKKLIATCFTGSAIAGEQLPLFDVAELDAPDDKTKQPYKIEINEVSDENGDGRIDIADVGYLIKNTKNILTLLSGDGSFSSPESLGLLQEADIVVTNPPFSLFREYVTQLIECGKQFIIIGNTNALTYKEIFKLIKEDKLRTGYTNFNVGMYFYVPDNYENYHKIENDRKMVRVSTCCWFTSLSVNKHKAFITLYKSYTPAEYPHYDFYDAINVDKVADIPKDWSGAMGVPITFLDKYNPQQFEILDCNDIRINNMHEKKYALIKDKDSAVNGKSKYARVVIRRIQKHED